MPIDFPTVKYGDPTTFPPSTPASTDTVMARTSAGADRNFALGNLAGIAPVAVANDQALVYTGGAWASYSLTAAGRALSDVAGTANTFPYFSAANVVTLGAVTATGLSVLSAASQAAARAAIQAVGTVGDENVDGVKTFTARPVFGAGATLALNQRFVCLVSGSGATPGFRGGSAGEFVVAAGANTIFLRPGGDTVMGTQVTITTDGAVNSSGGFRPIADNATDCATAAIRMRTYYGVNAAINTSDARLKTEPRQLREAEFKAASAIARLPAVWRWLNRVHGDENCEPEGREARKHFGPTVQAAMAVMEAHGLDPFAYSFICYDEWEAERLLMGEGEDWGGETEVEEYQEAQAVTETVSTEQDEIEIVEGRAVVTKKMVEHQQAIFDEYPMYDAEGNAVVGEGGRQRICRVPRVEVITRVRTYKIVPAGDRYSFRKEELLCFIVRALARENDEQAAKIEAQRSLLDDLLARVAALEAKG